MIATFSVLLGALLTGWLTPRVLGRVDLRRRDALPVMVWWLVSMVGFAVGMVIGVVLLLLPDHGTPAPLVALLHHCWSALQHGSVPKIEELGGLLGGSALLVLFGRVVYVGVRARRRRAATRLDYLTTLRLAARVEQGSPSTWWLAYDRPLAFSIAGRHGVVVATDGLTTHLDAAAVEAVLAHERAHLRNRHHTLLALVDTLSRALPFVPLYRKAPAAMRELVELAADATAVRTCGSATVHAALTHVAGHGAPDGALGMGQNAIAVRVERLRRDATPAAGLARAASCAAAGVAGVVVPFLAAAGLVLAVTLVTCPIGP